MEYLPFRIAGRDFVIDASRVRAIVPFEGSDHHDVPVFDLEERLGLPGVVYGRRQLLVVVDRYPNRAGRFCRGLRVGLDPGISGAVSRRKTARTRPSEMGVGPGLAANRPGRAPASSQFTSGNQFA